MKRSNDYQLFLIKELRKDPELAAGYLDYNLEDGDKEMFLLALRNVVEARGGMGRLSQHTKLNRPHLYKTLSKNGNPEIFTLFQLLDSLGLRLSILPKSAKSRGRKAPHAAFKKAA